MDPSVNSTPQARGLAANDEFNRDLRAGSPKNIKRVQSDLDNFTQVVPIIPFLASFVADIVIEHKDAAAGAELDPVFLEDVMKDSKRIFKMILRDAISFCNDSENAGRNELLNHLENYSNQPFESGRYIPLSNALNTILHQFADKSYMCIPSPSTRENRENLIYMPNDPNVIESSHLREDCPESLRKPDIVGVFESYLCKVDNNLEKKNFREIADLISEDAIKCNPDTPPEWTDIQQPWELKVKKRKLEMPRCVWNLNEILFDLKKETENNSRKRTRDTDDEGSSNTTTKSKASRGSHFHSIHTSILPDPAPEQDPLAKVPTRVQCAYYATERICSAWHATHSTVVLVEDTTLTMSRFDAQGCIQGVSFDIFKQLPVLVTMTVIMQRFSLLTWGLTERDALKVKVENKTFHLYPTPTPFQLNGRRTTGTFAKYDEDSADKDTSFSKVLSDDGARCTTDAGCGSPDDWDDGMPFFFKSSWTEWVRELEFQIIRQAHKRANTLLPEKYREMVTGHIPTIIAAQECKSVSTARFRLFLKFAGASPHLTVDDIQKRARVRVWIVMPRLFSVHRLEPSKFLNAFWDIIRCHYLLWKIGIAHGDISLSNLMYRPSKHDLIGMLNDFDLAAVMEPGTRSPPKTGWERTGTLPFMALDLIKYINGEIKRWYRHDLESFTWCLLREMLVEPNIRWAEGTFKEVFDSKRAAMSDTGEHSENIKVVWLKAYGFIDSWLQCWSRYKRNVDSQLSSASVTKEKILSLPETIEIRNKVDSDMADTVHIREAVEAAKEGLKHLDISALVETSWIDVELEKGNQ